MALLTRISARTAHRVITISDVRPRRHRPQLRARAGEGGRDAARRADPREAAPRPADDAPPVVLCVAQKRPYKNLGSLIHAVARASRRATRARPARSARRSTRPSCARSPTGSASRTACGSRRGSRTRSWRRSTREATCFVLPSLIEGFGLPVLEAMARGVPVACSDRPALPEVAGDAALLFDPTDQSAVTDAVRRLIRDADLRTRALGTRSRAGTRVHLAAHRRADACELSPSASAANLRRPWTGPRAS